MFGSEEYGSFTCSNFNDVFGFFISGPGYVVPKNIALIPGTAIPVCINSVNCGPTGGNTPALCNAITGPGSPYCPYYVNNSTGVTINYYGMTTTLTAIAAVTPCDTYHLKIGVADASDDVLDSGVFIEAGSLTSTGIHVSPQGINPLDTGFTAQYCIRGCNPGKFTFKRTGNLADSLTIHYLIGGTAVNGFDYATIADSIIMMPTDSTYILYINGLVVPPAGPKTVELYILGPYSCGGVPIIIDSAALTIYDSFYVHINTSDTVICTGQDVFINTSGAPHLVYLWSPSGTLDNDTLLSPTASPTITTTYTVSAIFPGAGCHASHATITINVVVPPTLSVGPPIQKTCMNVPLQLGVSDLPTGIAYVYSWSPTTYLNNATIANPVVTPGVAGDFEYYVTSAPPAPVVNCSSTDSFLLHVLPNDFTLFNQDTGVCFPPGTYQMRVDGDTEFTYHWSPAVGVSNMYITEPLISPPGTGKYFITASYPGCPDMVHSIAFSVEHPQVFIPLKDTTFCITLPISIPEIVTPADSPYTLKWTPGTNLSDSTIINPSFYSKVPGDYKYILTVTSGLGCWSADSVTYHSVAPIHISTSPDQVVIRYGDHIQLNAQNLTGSPLTYVWLPDDGTLDNPNINNPVAAPQVTTTYVAIAQNEWGCRDSAEVTVNVDFNMSECIPSAFTPNGDGLNDVFRLCNMKYQRLIEFSVFNRWGQMVFHNTTDPKKGWDGTFNGTPQDIGVYNYLIILSRPDGTNITYKGEVTLIR